MAPDPRPANDPRDGDTGSGDASANHADDGALPEKNELHRHEPAEFASGEVDIADAQLAMGRPDLAGSESAAADEPSLGGSSAEELFDSARHDDGGPLVPAGGGSGDGGDEASGVTRIGDRSPEPKRGGGGKFFNFLRGSARELQRVQWPDRNQVASATAVVVGFVIIAGAYLGAADWVAQRIVDVII